MPIGTKSDFVVYDEQIQVGIVDRITQNLNAFNNASDNALILRDERVIGDYERNAMFKNPVAAIRRDTTSTADLPSVIVEQVEQVSVKLNRGITPIEQTLDSFKKIGMMSDDALGEAGYQRGQSIADAILQDQLNNTIRALRAAIYNQAAVAHDSTTSLVTSDLSKAMSKMGDRSNEIVAWIMHSTQYFDLIGEQINPASQVYNVGSIIIQGGSPATYGRPVVVVDSPALIVDESVTSTPDLKYFTLGLRSNAATCKASEEETIYTEIISGKVNLTVRTQGEFAYNVGLQGFKWDVGGGENPTDAALGTGANWLNIYDDHKTFAGVAIKSSAAA